MLGRNLLDFMTSFLLSTMAMPVMPSIMTVNFTIANSAAGNSHESGSPMAWEHSDGFAASMNAWGTILRVMAFHLGFQIDGIVLWLGRES